MKFISITTAMAVLSYVGHTFASPVDSTGSTESIADMLEASKAIHLRPADSLANSTQPDKRALTHLYVCTDINFTGHCQNLQTFTGDCSGKLVLRANGRKRD